MRTLGPARLCKRWITAGVLAAAMLLPALVPLAAAQQPRHEADEALKAYLRDRGLRRVLAAELDRQIRATEPTNRGPLAEELGQLYVELLTEATSKEERRLWEDRGRDLLELSGGAPLWALRLSLFSTLYNQAEETMERHRLRLAPDAEVTEARRVLTDLAKGFGDIASRVHRDVESMEQREEKGDVSEELADALAEARKLRSQAFYFAGWSNYYLAYSTGAEEPASRALEHFGWVLNASGGRGATLERLPRGLLRYEHVSRAAIGSALALGERKNDTTALRWLDAVDEEAEVPAAVKSQVLPRRMYILAKASRWADLERLVRMARGGGSGSLVGGGGGSAVRPLEVPTARLLAVLTLEADKKLSGELIDDLTRVALADLIGQNEVQHVLDLVKRYGTLPLGEKGFIVNYVRGLQKYEEARAAHREKLDGKDPEEPTTDANVVAVYRDAAKVLQAAVTEPDADGFRTDRARAALLVGAASYFGGDVAKAGEELSKAAQLAVDDSQRDEALWMAVVALEKAAEQTSNPTLKREATTKLDRAVALYLRSFPDTSRAARLLLSRAASGVLEDEEALRVLLGVPADSSLYESARQHAARLLYGRWRAAPAQDRAFAATRFATVAEEVLRLEQRQAMEGGAEEGKKAAERAILRCRQILDALLSLPTPDTGRAEAILEVLQGVAVYNNTDLTAIKPEIHLRRLQLALAKGEWSRARELAGEIRAMEGAGTMVSAADRAILRHAANEVDRAVRVQRTLHPTKEQFELTSEMRSLLQTVIETGEQLLTRQLAEGADPKSNEVLWVRDQVAASAWRLWQAAPEAEDGKALRDRIVTHDRAILAVLPGNEPSLERLAAALEAAGDRAGSLECWRTLLAGRSGGSESWLEARYHSLRLLAEVDPSAAREAMDQHKLLNGGHGAGDWGEKIRELDRRMEKGALGGTNLRGVPEGRGLSGGTNLRGVLEGRGLSGGTNLRGVPEDQPAAATLRGTPRQKVIA